MAFSKVQVEESGKSVLYYEKPPKAPVSVWVLRVLIGVLLASGVMGIIKLADVFGSIRTQIAEHENRLYMESSYDFDMTIDGRWRWCRENPEECVMPWGNQTIPECIDCLGQGQVDFTALQNMTWDEAFAELAAYMDDSTDCPCRDLFTSYGWGETAGPAVAFSNISGLESEDHNGSVEFFFNLRNACNPEDDACMVSYQDTEDVEGSFLDLPCGNTARTSYEIDVPLVCWSDYPLFTPEDVNYGSSMLNFVGRETLKVMNVTLYLVIYGIGGFVLFLVFRWTMVFIATFKATPRTHLNMAKTGITQIVLEIAKIYLVGTITAVSYPFAMISDSMGLALAPLALSIVVIAFSLLPSSQRYFSAYKIVSHPQGEVKTDT